MKRKKRAIREFLIYIAVIMSILLFILVCGLYSFIGMLKNEINNSSEDFIKIYSSELSNVINKMDEVLKNVALKQEEFIGIRNSDSNRRAMAAIALHNYMKTQITLEQPEDLIVVFEKKYEVCLDAVKSTVNYNDKEKIREYISNIVRNYEHYDTKWEFIKINDTGYMYKLLVSNGRGIAVFTNTSNLLPSLEIGGKGERFIVLSNNDGTIGRVWGKKSEYVSDSIRDIYTNSYYKISKEIIDGQLSVSCYTNKMGILKNIDIRIGFILLLGAYGLIFITFMLVHTNKKIIKPIKIIMNNINTMKEQGYGLKINEDFDYKELGIVKDTANEMIDEIGNLKIQAYKKKIELQEIELRSIRLQLKPHFFLNALTTISSLSSQNMNLEIVEYIASLSKNVRYMFKAGFHTVSIKEEIDHVENYIEMQEIKYPGCIFSLIDIPIELSEWKIPQMIIHTFIENEYKHAVDVNKILTVFIKIRTVIYKGEEMLKIEIEDDGKGYPDDVLLYMNSDSSKIQNDGSRIGLCSVKKILKIMYERDDLIYLKNLEPHGCLNVIYIPKDTIYKVNEEHIK